MEQFKINRDWRTIKAVPDCTQNYGNGVISQLATWY